MAEPMAWKDWEDRLLQLDHLMSCGQIAAEAAHQINNCLEGIKNYLYLLGQDLPQPEQNPTLNIVQEEVFRIAEIVSHMTGFQRLGRSRQIQPVRRVLERVLHLLSGRMRRLGIAIHWGAFDESFRSISASELGQIFFNVLVNAVESMPQGGAIHLVAHRQGQGLTVVLQDEGCGIDSDEMARVFEPFYTNKPQRLGLGLPVCKSLAGRIQAELELKSQPGVGTAVALHLTQEAMPPPQSGSGNDGTDM